jgi:hypothetical protein
MNKPSLLHNKDRLFIMDNAIIHKSKIVRQTIEKSDNRQTRALYYNAHKLPDMVDIK